MRGIGSSVRYWFLFCRACCAAAVEGVITKKKRKSNTTFATSFAVMHTPFAWLNLASDDMYTVNIYSDEGFKCTSRAFLNPGDAHTWAEGYVRRNPGFFWEFA